MKALFAWRSLLHTPRRTLLVLGGYALGVGVMIGLLSVGDALLEQAENKVLFGGGDLLLVPVGLNVELIQVGATAALFYRLENARFLTRQVLRGPRFGADVAEVSPFLTRRLVYLRRVGKEGEREEERGKVAAFADGSLPDQERAVGGPAPDRTIWRNNAADERWLHPTPAQLYHEIDHFHRPSLPEVPKVPVGAGLRASPPKVPKVPEYLSADHQTPDTQTPRHPTPETGGRWGEWHYFNWLEERTGLYGYVSFLVGSPPLPPLTKGGRGGVGDRRVGLVSVQVKRPGRPPERYVQVVPEPEIAVSEEACDVRLGRSTVRFVEDRYVLHVDLLDAATHVPVAADLTVRPVRDLYYPPFTLTAGSAFESGYVVPALRADVHGTLCLGDGFSVGAGLRASPAGASRLRLDGAVGYHDHNWGYWKEVYWDWGLASSPEFSLIYGRFHHPEVQKRADWSRAFLILSEAAPSDLWSAEASASARPQGDKGVSPYRPHSQGRAEERPGGFLALFRPDTLTFTGERVQAVPGGTVRVPETIRMDADNGSGERLTVTIRIREAVATLPKGIQKSSRVFLQMRGQYTVQGTVAGQEIRFTAEGFAETFREKE